VLGIPMPQLLLMADKHYYTNSQGPETKVPILTNHITNTVHQRYSLFSLKLYSTIMDLSDGFSYFRGRFNMKNPASRLVGLCVVMSSSPD